MKGVILCPLVLSSTSKMLFKVSNLPGQPLRRCWEGKILTGSESFPSNNELKLPHSRAELMAADSWWKAGTLD